jgi:predicted ribosome quality control (RQC) complex YloA/Tae2 family protein
LLTNYFTLNALVDEWNELLLHSTLVDGYSQHKGSLILVFLDENDQVWSLNTSVQAPNRHIFVYSGSNRSRKNVVDVFPTLRNQKVSSISIADGDRLITFTFESGDVLLFAVYGPKANVFLKRPNTGITDSFRGSNMAPPDVRPAPEWPTATTLHDVLTRGGSISGLLPLFPGQLVQEVWARAGGTEDPKTIETSIFQLKAELDRPEGLIYWDANRNPLLSVIPLQSQQSAPERFDSVNEAVRVCARRRLAITRFKGLYDPLLGAIESRALAAQKSLDRVVSELQKPSRAEDHEAAGHLIMAQPNAFEKGQSTVVVQDWLSGGDSKTLPMDPTLSAIENAQKYYQKAKASRLAREKSLERLMGLKKTAQEMERLHVEALSLSSVEDVEAFQKKHEHWLRSLTSQINSTDTIPYRQYILDGGYEVWVGRNAKQNDQLTMKDARKHDLWLHARGVAGSHTVLRLNSKTDIPPKTIIEQAASIAAWHSKARPSSLVPVIVVSRKYVRKPRKALPGAVLVEREKVILVEPKIPE